MYAGILSQLCLHAKVRGDKTALRVLGGKEKVVNEVTYSELWRMIMQFSNYLEHVCGLKQGERFCVCLDNSVELICMYAASLATKTVCIPIDYLAPLGAVLDILQQVRPRWILLADVSLQKCVSEKFSNAVMLDLNEMQSCCNGAEIVHELCCTVEPWVVLFTSGTTTGVKKGVVRTELGSVAGFFSHCPDMHFCSEDIFLAIYPLHAISSFFFVFMHLYFGASCCMLSRVDSHVPEILMHVLHSQKITFTTAGPMQVSCMIKTGIQCPASLSRILVSGAVTKEVVQNRIRLFFATAKVFEIYGSTEAGLITLLSPEQQLLHPGSVGIEPAGNLEVQFVHPVDGKLMAITSKDQPGEILVYTPMLFLEFFERSDLNNRCRTGQGYFKTGDLGYKGNDGFLYLSGRIDDRIDLASGRSFFPAEIENYVLQVENMIQAFLFQSNYLNELVIAVEVKPGAKVELEDILQVCTLNCLRECLPQKCWILNKDELSETPRTSTGKLIRCKLPDFYCQFHQK